MICSTSIKCWPVEYHAQSAVEASLHLREQIPDVSQIESVLIQSHDASVDIIGSEPEKWHPSTRETADHSLPYIVAAALTDGEITDRQFSSQRFEDPGLLDLLQRVKVVRNAELTAAYPRTVANIVTVKLRTGDTLTRRVDHACGAAMNPMSDQAVEAKFHRLADERIGNDQANRVLEFLWKLRNARSQLARPNGNQPSHHARPATGHDKQDQSSASHAQKQQRCAG